MRTFLLFLLLCCSSTIFAQNYILIKGKIIDAKTHKAIAYAHIGIPERGIGTTSAGNGSFLLKLPKYFANSKLTVSFIGYKTYERPVATIKKYLTIKLQRISTELQEIVVMDEAVVENIIRKAVKRIPKNYPTTGSNLTGFYRESKTDKDERYLYLAEGVLEVYKTSYRNKKDGQLKLLQGRKMDLVNPDSTRISTFTSGHWSSHRFDFVKNREDFIDEKYFPVYKYWLSGITEYNGRAVYVINFEKDENAKNVYIEETYSNGSNGILSALSKLGKKKKRKKLAKARMEGKIYIDTLSYAFLRAEFSITKQGLRKTNDYPLYVGRWKSNSYVVNYRKFGNKWYFSESLREGRYYDGGIYRNEFVTTEISPKKGKPIKYLDRIQRNIAFRRNTGDFHPDFWKAYNVTLMSDGLRESVDQMKRNQLSNEVFDIKKMTAEQERKDSLERIELAQLDKKGKYIERDEMGEIIIPSPERVRYLKRTKRFRTHLRIGAGTHLLKSEAANYGLNYTIAENKNFGINENIKARNFEVFVPLDFDLVFKDRFLIRLGQSLEFYNSIYREKSFGLGFQFNLSKGRPFYIRGIVQNSRLQYARKIGQAINTSGDFKLDKKKFKSDKINMYYGARTKNLKTSFEMAIEIHADLEFFASASYLLPYATEQRVYLWERDRFLLSRKKRYTAVDELKVDVQKNDAPFNGDIVNFKSFMFSVGFIVK